MKKINNGLKVSSLLTMLVLMLVFGVTVQADEVSGPYVEVESPGNTSYFRYYGEITRVFYIVSTSTGFSLYDEDDELITLVAGSDVVQNNSYDAKGNFYYINKIGDLYEITPNHQIILVSRNAWSFEIDLETKLIVSATTLEEDIPVEKLDISEKFSTEAPTTTETPSEQPTTQAPSTKAPTTEAPTTQAPKPEQQTLTTEAPTTQAPVVTTPVTGVSKTTKAVKKGKTITLYKKGSSKTTVLKLKGKNLYLNGKKIAKNVKKYGFISSTKFFYSTSNTVGYTAKISKPKKTTKIKIKKISNGKNGFIKVTKKK